MIKKFRNNETADVGHDDWSVSGQVVGGGAGSGGDKRAVAMYILKGMVVNLHLQMDESEQVLDGNFIHCVKFSGWFFISNQFRGNHHPGIGFISSGEEKFQAIQEIFFFADRSNKADMAEIQSEKERIPLNIGAHGFKNSAVAAERDYQIRGRDFFCYFGIGGE